MLDEIKIFLHADIWTPDDQAHVLCPPKHFEAMRKFFAQNFETIIMNREINEFVETRNTKRLGEMKP